MKISSSRNIFDLLYLDILENSMENILSLNCGEECRILTCFLQHSPSRQTSIQSSPADHAECFSKFLELCFVKALGEDIHNLFFCLSRHHYDLTLKDHYVAKGKESYRGNTALIPDDESRSRSSRCRILNKITS